MQSFNLTTEAWIPCRMAAYAEHKLQNLSLEETLVRAHEVAEIVGDSPPVTIALHRLLLAVLHRSLGVLEPKAWKEVRAQDKFDGTKIGAYLDKFRDRFDLFDKQHPFYQARDVRPAGNDDSIMPLAFQSTAAAAFFGDRTNPSLPPLTAAQAARFLVAFQAFDVGGLKSSEGGVGTDGQDRESFLQQEEVVARDSKKEDRAATAAPLLNTAVALARGGNLFETLMLNLYWQDENFFTSYDLDERDSASDKPAWEQESPTSTAKRGAFGYLDLLTWQSRRIRLGSPFDEDGTLAVPQAVVIKGHRFPDKYERYDKETMLTFTRNRDPKSKREGYLPLGFNEDKALWRDAHALFHSIKDEQSKPLMLGWLDRLREADALPEEAIIPLDFLGFSVSRAAPKYWRHQRLPLPLRYLRDAELCGELKAAMNIAEAVAKVLTASVHRLAVLMFAPDYHLTNAEWFTPRLPKLRRASASDKEKRDERDGRRDGDITNLRAGFAPELRYWSRLESEFRRLLITLAKDKTRWQDARARWWQTLERVSGQAFSEIVSGAGTSERTLRAMAIAEQWFEGEMRGRRKRYFKPIEEARGHRDESNYEEGDEAR